MAIARRPGVLTKVAIRPRRLPFVELAPTAALAGPTGIGADDLAGISRQLDGERLDVVRWRAAVPAYIAAALGLGEVPPMLLSPGISHARVLLGEIDLLGIAGWRSLNVVLASALTGWRIRLEAVAATEAWRRLARAMRDRRAVPAELVGPSERGARVQVLGLYALISGPRDWPSSADVVDVLITRMDADEGRIFVAPAPGPGPSGQPSLAW